MRLFLPGVGLAVVLSSFAAQQGRPTPPKTKTSEPSNRQTIRVRGCINGRTLFETQGGSGTTLITYRLTGSRGILASLKEHEGHEDEIVGTVQIADDKKYKVTKEKKLGKGRVFGSASAEDTSAVPPQGDEFPIDVDSITHVSTQCPHR
jgi:hypothetical protein